MVKIFTSIITLPNDFKGLLLQNMSAGNTPENKRDVHPCNNSELAVEKLHSWVSLLEDLFVFKVGLHVGQVFFQALWSIIMTFFSLNSLFALAMVRFFEF